MNNFFVAEEYVYFNPYGSKIGWPAVYGYCVRVTRPQSVQYSSPRSSVMILP